MKGKLSNPFIKGIAGFGGFALVNQAGAFFLIPIYWQYLGPSDYGIIGIFTIVVTVLSAVFTFGFNGVVERYFFEWSDVGRSVKIKTLFVVQLCVMLLLSLLLHFVSWKGWVGFNSVEYFPVIYMALVTSSLLSVQYIPFSILRVDQRIKAFGIVSMVSFFLTSFLTIFFLAYADYGVMGYLYGQFYAAAIMALVWFVFMSRFLSVKGLVGVKEELHYSAPNTPLTIISRASEVVDRVVLERLLSLNLFGLYSFSSQFGGYFNGINSVLKLAFYPLIFKMVVKDKQGSGNVSSLSLFYVFILAQLGVLAIVFFEAFVFWFGEQKFYGAFDYIPFFILAGFIKGVGTAFGVGIEIAKVPHKALYAVIPSSVSAVMLALILIPIFGIAGGIFSLIVSVSVKSIISIYLGHKAFPRKFPWLQFLCIIAVNGCLVWGICYFRVDDILGFVVKALSVCGCSGAFFMILYLNECFDFDNKERVEKVVS